MRRVDREVKDFDEIVKIIDKCDILRLGLSDGDFPYIVPVNFGYTANKSKNEICFYIHGAVAGKKYEMLCKNPFCSVEMDIALEMDCIKEKKDVTMRYKSVMAKCRVEFLQNEEKKWAVDKILMARYEKTKNFEYNVQALARTAVAKLTVIEISAKANLAKNAKC